ncbi:MAG: DmsE family decaheme c-type cytochrome [Thiobacillaceae bacterium]
MFEPRKTPKRADSVFILFVAALWAMVCSTPALAVPPGMELIFDGGPKPVIFSGQIHADHGLVCKDCHPGIFKMEKGNAKIAFADHLAGKKYCFTCHNGTKAYAAKGNCNKCHGNKSPNAVASEPGMKGETPKAAEEQKAEAPKAASVATQEAPKPPPPKKKEEAPLPVTLEEKEARVEELAKAKYQNAGTCLGCHDEDYRPAIYPIFKTKHAAVTDARTPFANQQCEACHGAGGVHVKARKKRGGTIIAFGKNAWTPVKDQNEKCLACHQTHQRIEWKGSTHEFNNLACASCHKIHVEHDPVLDREQQASVCFTCHKSKQAKFFQLSHHPVREGQMACSECHNVHGEDGSGLMVKALSREKCTSCHADKRGPVLWEHAPVAEDCTICHDPHGSNQPALLKKRVPQLCQECHDPAGHPGGLYDGSKLIGGSAFLQVKSCLNCHSAIHGSNDPSGSTLLR